MTASAGPRHHPRSLAGTIFRTVLLFSLFLILVFALAVGAIFYQSFERTAERRLVQEAQAAALALNANPAQQTEISQVQFVGSIRYTLIGADGVVLVDSATDVAAADNHATRPEVIEANKQGVATALRYSATLKTDTIYAAVELDNGGIVRLSEERQSLFIFWGDMLIPLIIALIVVTLLAFFVSRTLTRRIMGPIDALNFKEPLENEIYSEMDPLLVRIDEQQAQLKTQNKELAVAENMRREFSSNVSHEMKTPLTVISGYAELMKNDMVAAADRQKFAELIYEEAQAMRSLINDVLTISRLDETVGSEKSDQPVDLFVTAKIVAGRLRSFAEGNGVTIAVEGESAFVLGVDTLCEEMLYNLIENGIRYNHVGGSVTLRVDDAPTGPVVVVSDTGAGIAEEYKDKVFERFFRVDKSRSKETGGTGLGLAIVKHAVQYHHGTIELASKQGSGTKFILHFPPFPESN
ncbi:MAG: ATP-binding protein [Raoultibacter sp.]